MHFIAIAKRPDTLTKDIHKPIVVALHGAGVELDEPFWVESIPAQASSWVYRSEMTFFSASSNLSNCILFSLLLDCISIRKNIMVG